MRKIPVRFVERVNGGTVSNGAVIASGADLDLDAVTIPFLADHPSVPASKVTVLAPAGIRAGDEVAPGDLLVLASSDAVGDLGAISGENVYGVTLESFFPSEQFTDDPWSPSERWLHEDAPFLSAEGGKAVVALGDRSPEEVFGAFDTGNNPFLTGNNPFDTGNNPFLTGNNPFLTGNNPFLVAMTGDVAVGGQSPFTAEALLDAGEPAPLGGVTFGMGVLSTPDASVAGESANPLVDEATPDLLAHDAARRTLASAGLTDADQVEWLSGPEPVADVPDGTEFTMLDESGELESFTGVVSGKQGPWWVGVHVARVTGDDHVVAAGVQRAPVGSVEGAPEAGRAMAAPLTDLVPAREYAVETVGRLAVDYRE